MNNIKELRKDIKYMFQFRSSFIYKINYILSFIIKIIIYLFTKKYKASYFLITGEFIIKNSLGTFKIIEPSDMHAILKPHNEIGLKKYFDINQGTFIDIGANIGKYSVIVGKNHKTKVFSIEVNPTMVRFLQENIKLNHLHNVTVIHEGVGEQKGDGFLNIPKNHYGSASIVNTTKDQHKIPITIDTLDNIIHKNHIDISNIQLIKMDIEGYELQALKGFEKNISKMIDHSRIIAECFGMNYEHQLISFLKKYGFIQIDMIANNLVFEKQGFIHNS